MSIRVFIIIASLVFSNLSIISQDIKVISDFRLIGKLGVTKQLFDSWEIGIEGAIKLEEDATRIDEIDLDLDVNYQPHSIIVFGVGYRLVANKKKNGSYKQRQRLYGDVQFNFKLKRFKIEYRIRYQNVDDDFFQYNDTSPAENILRNRLQLKYNIRKSKLTPYCYAELYGELGKEKEFPLKMKFALGGRYSFGKYGKIRAYYRIDRELNNKNPFTFYSIGLGYRYKF